jgi:hypothetical protein
MKLTKVAAIIARGILVLFLVIGLPLLVIKWLITYLWITSL